MDPLDSMPPEHESPISLDDEDLVAELDRRLGDTEGAIPWADLRAEEFGYGTDESE
jgi:hypothetical protein